MTQMDTPAGPAEPLLNIVLHEPEIPNNTGNIGRTCVALRSRLHLIEPLGFDIDEKACRRAGLDYWPRLDLRVHTHWDGYALDTRPAKRWMLTTRSARSVLDAEIRPGDHLVFGRESRGLPGEILDAHEETCVCLPMAPGERSLNLSTAVCAVMYLALRGCVSRGEASLDGDGRLVMPAGRG